MKNDSGSNDKEQYKHDRHLSTLSRTGNSVPTGLLLRHGFHQHIGLRHANRCPRARVKTCEGPIASLTADSNIYQVTAAQVKEYVAGQGEVIVYEFTPWCNGDRCVIPMAAEKAIRERGYGFCLVAIGYDHPERLAAVITPSTLFLSGASASLSSMEDWPCAAVIISSCSLLLL